MSDPISPRAQAILDEIERASGPRPSDRPIPPTSGPRTPLFPAPPPAAEPDARAGPPRPLQDPATSGELGQLVEDVVTQAEQARLRLSALSAAIEDIAGRLGLPLEGSVTVLRHGEPQDALAPAHADVIELPVREEPGTVPQLPAPDDSGRMAETMRLDESDRPDEAPPEVNGSAHLVAVEMAVSGYSREEVGERLRSLYGIPHPEATLDAVFGSGTPGGTRAPIS